MVDDLLNLEYCLYKDHSVQDMANVILFLEFLTAGGQLALIFYVISFVSSRLTIQKNGCWPVSIVLQ